MITQKKPLIVVTLMVKDESLSIQPTLSSFLEGGLTHFFVLDTGSNDNTVPLAQKFFQKNNVTGYIKQESFIDFATSRNRTLELAEQQFPDACFFIMSDAEWHLHNSTALISFCEQEKTADTALYLINIHMNSVEFTTARLFRAANRIRFKGVVHEVPEIVATIKAPDSVYFEVKSTEYGVEKSKRRWQQDLLLLSNAFYENKNDPRTAFYLAQTYECLGLFENAYQVYQHRDTLQGWDEENFITLYRLGCLAEQLSATNNNITWQTAMDYFLKAFSLRPHRIEPLIKIAEHYWPTNAQACYLFIKHACDLPYPKHDILFIEKNTYLYERYEIMSRCAWYAGEYKLGEQATLIALSVCPETEHLKNNLSLYQGKLATNVTSSSLTNHPELC
ncbi:MAG: hypothetical protein Q8R24_04290 [Legionellaceae bacterium]|nr:hypothetical protein [Legionellaceae bacterium]